MPLPQAQRPEPTQRSVRERAFAVLAAAAMALTLTALAPAIAVAETAEAKIAAFARAPSALRAVEIAEALRDARRYGQAANWAERTLVMPNRGGAHGRALRLLDALKWPLRDDRFGLVELRVEPAHATVAIDEKLILPRRGRYRVWLPAGSHQMVVTLNGYTSVERIITAQIGETRTQVATLKDVRPATLVLEVAPVNAEVWIDGAYAGLATKGTFSTRAGRRLFEVRADGFVSYTDALDLAPNETRKLDITLERAGAMRRSRTSSSDVQRELTPLELANRGERHRVGRRPHDRLRQRGIAPIGSGDAGDVKPTTPGELPDDAPPPPNTPPPDEAPAEDAPPPAATDPGADLGDDVSAGVSAGGGAGLSGLLKGVIWSSVGVVLIGGGVGTAIYGASATELANDLRLGHKSYDAYYEYGATLTYAGYGVAGLGAIAAGVGGAYLFGNEGLPRRGKGVVLVSGGALAAGVGGWLMLRAGEAATVADGFPIGDPRYDARIAGAESTWRAGLISASVGGVALAAGVYLALSKGGGRGFAASSLRLLPRVSTSERGAVLAFDF